METSKKKRLSVLQRIGSPFYNIALGSHNCNDVVHALANPASERVFFFSEKASRFLSNRTEAFAGGLTHAFGNLRDSKPIMIEMTKILDDRKTHLLDHRHRVQLTINVPVANIQLVLHNHPTINEAYVLTEEFKSYLTEADANRIAAQINENPSPFELYEAQYEAPNFNGRRSVAASAKYSIEY